MASEPVSTDPPAEPELDLERVGRIMLAAPQIAALGIRQLASGKGTVQLHAPWREDLVGDPEREIIAGGVVTTLLDHTCSTALATLRKGGGPTLDLRVDYMRAAAPRAGVTAQARVYKMTRSVAFIRASAWDADPDDPIATAQAAFSLPERRK